MILNPFSKKAKLKRQLLKLSQAFKDLSEPLNTDDSDQDISTLKISKIHLEQSRIAALYDDLKEQYPDFTSLQSNSECGWKLDKPAQSEGTIFSIDFGDTVPGKPAYIKEPIAYYCARYDWFYYSFRHSPLLVPLQQYHVKLEKYKPKSFLRNALLAKAKHRQHQSAKAKASDYTLDTKQPVKAVALYEFANKTSDHIILDTSIDCLYDIAVKTKTNIIQY